MGAPEVTAFLTAIAVRDRVAASTQNQALNALLFLYRQILNLQLPWLDDIVRAKRPQHLPVVLTRDETQAVDRCEVASTRSRPLGASEVRRGQGSPLSSRCFFAPVIWRGRTMG